MAKSISSVLLTKPKNLERNVLNVPHLDKLSRYLNLKYSLCERLSEAYLRNTNTETCVS